MPQYWWSFEGFLWAASREKNVLERINSHHRRITRVYIVYLEQGFSKFDRTRSLVVLLNVEMFSVFSLDSFTALVRWNFLDQVTYDDIT